MSERKRWLEVELLNHAGISSCVVVDAIAGAHYRVHGCLPGNPNPGSEIVTVWTYQRVRKPRMPGNHRQHRNQAGREYQIDDLIVQLGVRRNIFVAQAEIET